MPITCVGQSSSEIEVYQNQDSPTEMYICWPVVIEASSMRSGSSFSMSVWPDCLGGGFKWTNSCCAVLSSGGWSYSYTCAENCLCTGCSADGYYGYEAYRLPANGGSCGCSSHGEIEGGGDDDDPPSVGVSVSFSKDAVVFEDTYETSPGVFVQKRSTTVKLKVSAFGGPNGGTASFTTTNFSKLSPLACGPLQLPSNLVLGPYGTYSEEFTCEGASASGAANDVIVSGSFEENVTGESYEAQDQITVFRVEISANYFPSGNTCTNRHKYGVRELVNVLQSPMSPMLAWSRMGGGRIIDNKYQCPLLPCEKPLQFMYSGVAYTPYFQVVAPEGVYVDSVTEWVVGLPNGEAGGIGMTFAVYLTPFDVSFAGIAVEEVPCYTGSHEGYFSHSHFESDWYHTRAAGAGKWQSVAPNNCYGVDTAAISNSLPRMTPGGVVTNDVQFGWQYGSIVWQVPMGWGESNSVDYDDPAGLFREDATQEMVIFADGKCGVRKFRHMVTREVDGTVYLDGRQVR